MGNTKHGYLFSDSLASYYLHVAYAIARTGKEDPNSVLPCAMKRWCTAQQGVIRPAFVHPVAWSAAPLAGSGFQSIDGLRQGEHIPAAGQG